MAAGRVAGTVWWSTMTTSMPSSRARATSATLAMPQSSETRRREPSRGDALDGAEVESVSLVDAVRDVGLGWSADGVEEEGEERGGADAVDVVVTVEGDLLSLENGAGEPLDGGGHALHPERVGEVGELVGEEPGGVLGIADAAGDEDAGGERIEPELDGEAPGGVPLGLDVWITTGNTQRKPTAPLVQMPVVANVRTGAV